MRFHCIFRLSYPSLFSLIWSFAWRASSQPERGAAGHDSMKQFWSHPSPLVELPSSHSSPQVNSKELSPHTQAGGHVPQSVSQLEQVSLPLHAPSPQLGVVQAPQSPAQVEQVSSPVHERSPQTAGQLAQSAAQEEHVSVASQVESPQTGPPQVPQSSAQDEQFSPPLQA